MSFADELKKTSNESQKNTISQNEEFDSQLKYFINRCKENAKKGMYACEYGFGISYFVNDDGHDAELYKWEPYKAKEFASYAQKLKNNEYGFSDVQIQILTYGGFLSPKRSAVKIKVTW